MGKNHPLDAIGNAAAATVKNFNNLLGLLESYAGGCAICTDTRHKTLDHPPAPSSSAKLTMPDGPKMLRETLCVAQTAIGLTVDFRDHKAEHIERLQALIDQLDVHRPLGPDGKHGDSHSATCGCEDK